jgi:hypothetical protein
MVRSSGDEFGKLFEAFPFVRSVVSYIYARESVSLSYLRSFAADLDHRFQQIADAALREEATFWLIVGLIESDQFELVPVYLDRFVPRDPLRFLCLLMSLGMARAYRSATPQIGRTLDKLQATVKEKAKPFQAEVKKIIDAEMLEFRNERLFKLRPGSIDGDEEIVAEREASED